MIDHSTDLLGHMVQLMCDPVRPERGWTRQGLHVALIHQGWVDEGTVARNRIGGLLAGRPGFFEHVYDDEPSDGSPRSTPVYRMACTLPEALEKLSLPPMPIPWRPDPPTQWARLLDVDYD